MVKSNPVLGIIGGGQLGSMLSAAAKKLQIKTVVLTDDINAPAKNFCDEIIFSEYGKIISVDLPIDEMSKNHKGIAII